MGWLKINMDIEVLSLDEEENSSFCKDVKYLINFITRSFLIAIICFIVILVILFIVYCADLFINTKNGNNKSPLFNAYVIISPSMLPTIKVNDAVVIKRIDGNYKIGDIVTFLSSDINYDGLTITHRIVDKGKTNGNKLFYTTKGDNNLVNDSTPVFNEAIYGKVIFKIPKIGYVHKFLSKPSNFFLCILVPTIIIIVYDLFRIAKMMSRKEEII